MNSEWKIRAIIAVASVILSALGTWLISDHTRIGQTETDVAVSAQKYESLCNQIESLTEAVDRLDRRLNGNGGSPGMVSSIAMLSIRVDQLQTSVARLNDSVDELRARPER